MANHVSFKCSDRREPGVCYPANGKQRYFDRLAGQYLKPQRVVVAAQMRKSVILSRS